MGRTRGANNTLDDIAVLIGFSNTVKLSAWYSARRGKMYIPAKVTEEHKLVKLIGMSAACKLTKEWGGEELIVPTMQVLDNEILRRRIARMFEQGFSSREIALDLKMDERRVQQICRELEAEGLMKVVVLDKGGWKKEVDE